MDHEKAEPHYIALVSATPPDGREAARLVRSVLAERGERPWEAMEIEVYPGEGNSLIIARPAAGERVYISRLALEILTERSGGLL